MLSLLCGICPARNVTGTLYVIVHGGTHAEADLRLLAADVTGLAQYAARFGYNLSPMDEMNLYSTIGEEGFGRLVAAFYRQVPEDDILSRMYPADDLQGAEERLRDFLIGRFGGPQRYIERRGHPRLRMRHAPFYIDQAARDRWMALMDKAFAEAALPADAEEFLRGFLSQTATFMINQAG